MARLIAIVEVDRNSKVYCQAPCCNKTVYKRIHVVEDESKILVVGGQCYSILYGSGLSGTGPAYFSGMECRKLTQDERNLLIENTRRLIEQFEIEARAAICPQIEEPDSPLLSSDFQPVKAVHLRNVKCTYCGAPTTTVLHFKPASGYRCDTCRFYDRPAPNRRHKITQEMNAMANRSARDTVPGNPGIVKGSDSADAYRKASGK